MPEYKRVLFISGVEEAPLRYRVYLPVEALRRLGIESEVRFYTDPALVQLTAESDLVVLFRVPANRKILQLIDSLHQQQKPVVFDIDDLVFDRKIVSSIPWLHTLPPVEVEVIRRRSELLRMTMESCDGVIASTAPLCVEIQKLGMPCFEFPNGAGEQLIKLSNETLTQSHDSFRIGYLSGTFTHQADWLLIEAAVIEFMDHHPEVELWMVGQVKNTPNLARFGERVKFLPFVPWQHLPALTRQLDVNLAPLTPGTFNECKSAIKWLEASLVQVATIASSIPPFTNVIKQNENGMLANTSSEWRDCLEQLRGDAEFKLRIAEQARKDAIEEFGPRRQSERYASVLKWIETLEPRKVVTETSVPDLPSQPHALEPFDLTLVASRTFPRVPTKPLTDGPIEFRLTSTSSKRLRLDLLFATYGNDVAPVKVVALDAANNEQLAEVEVDEDRIGEESWTAFELELGRSSKELLIRVQSRARLGLWADVSGSHQQGNKRVTGSPCFKLWASEVREILPTSDSQQLSFIETTMARLRYARYLWRVKGANAAWRRARQTAETNLWRRRHNS